MRQVPVPTGKPADCIIKNDFRLYDRNYECMSRHYLDNLHRLHRPFKQPDPDLSLQASQQYYIYAKWLARYTAHWKRLNRQMERLENSFLLPDQSYVASQSPEDGSWGWHYQEFHHKMDATIGRLYELAEEDRAPAYPLKFLHPLSSKRRMLSYLENLRISNIAETGRNQRDEFGGVISCLAQICFKPGLRDYVRRHVPELRLTDGYIKAFESFLDESQNPETGYWGPWYQSDGALYRYDDLSYTFHIISYRKGRIRGWRRIIETTLVNSQREYPNGWLVGGKFNNHNSYDVAKIFRFAWPYMTAQEQGQAANAIHRMLNWCLYDSMDPEGYFHCRGGFYHSVENAFYFGIALLDETGFFDRNKRFWTTDSFLPTPGLREKIAHYLGKLNQADDMVSAAWWKLGCHASAINPCHNEKDQKPTLH